MTSQEFARKLREAAAKARMLAARSREAMRVKK